MRQRLTVCREFSEDRFSSHTIISSIGDGGCFSIFHKLCPSQTCEIPCTVRISQTYSRCFIQTYRQARGVTMIFMRHFEKQSAQPPFWSHLKMAACAYIHTSPSSDPSYESGNYSYSTYSKTTYVIHEIRAMK